jgi:hypothetical protein
MNEKRSCLFALLLLFFLLALLMLASKADAHTQYDAQCMMLFGCSYHPTGDYVVNGWMMWMPWLGWLHPHMYEYVQDVSEWRWVEVSNEQGNY